LERCHSRFYELRCEMYYGHTGDHYHGPVINPLYWTTEEANT
jgi:hypothetical protein